MARAIDADRLADGLKLHRQPTDQKHEADRQWAVGYNAGLDRALHSIAYAPTLTQPNEPLTWEELEKLKSSPVYIDMIGVNSYWALVRDINDCGVWLMTVDDIDDYGSHRLYGKTWLAYRRPPEGEEEI